jgi:pseudouridine-5'-phosphate glycosidase
MIARATGPHGPISVGGQAGEALASGRAVVALESAVLTHGLPRPTNVELALTLEATVRSVGAVPATVGVVKGTIHVGLTEDEIKRLGESTQARKLGPRDLASAIVEEIDGGTTVGATMLAASRCGIVVFATGGIGGVHRENAQDVSADLHALQSIPMVVISAGAKAILDLPRTLEYLETLSVPVVGYRTTEFPAFYSRDSGFPLELCLETPQAIVQYWNAHRSLGSSTALLVCNPPPASDSIQSSVLEPLLLQASHEAASAGIRGKGLTPYLLRRVNELTNGQAMRTNLALLKSNAALGAEIACAISEATRQEETQ